MKVKCPKCGHVFEVIVPERTLEVIPIPAPFKAFLECGHCIEFEFAYIKKGQTIYCDECGKARKVIKILDITGKEIDE